jgi:hypothetical protein
MTNKLDYRRYQSAVSMFSQIQEIIRARQAHIVKPKHRHPCSSGQVLSLCIESRNLKAITAEVILATCGRAGSDERTVIEV